MGARGISVQCLLAGSEDRLGLTQMMGQKGLTNRLHHVQVQYPFHGGVCGLLRHNIVLITNPDRRCPLNMRDRESSPTFLEKIRDAKIPCIFVSATKKITHPLCDVYEQTGIPLLASVYDAYVLESRLTELLREKIAHRVRVHGVMLKMFGLGVLIRGDSGAGKTTVGVMLVRMGHTWIADDAIEIKKKQGKRLCARGVKFTRNLIDLKGSGILNTRNLFDSRQLAEETELHLILEIQRRSDISRRGHMENVPAFREIMETRVPCIHIPWTIEHAFNALEIESRVKAFGRNGGP
jgi:serine kinase of HPr protein (carbohydrate metabolism regulator)